MKQLRRFSTFNESIDLTNALKELELIIESCLELSDKFSNLLFRIEWFQEYPKITSRGGLSIGLSDYDNQNQRFQDFLEYFDFAIKNAKPIEIYFTKSRIDYFQYSQIFNQLSSPIQKMYHHSWIVISNESKWSNYLEPTSHFSIKFKKGLR